MTKKNSGRTNFLSHICKNSALKIVAYFLEKPKLIDILRKNIFVHDFCLKILNAMRSALGDSEKSVRTVSFKGTDFKILLNPENGSVDRHILAFRTYEPKISSVIRKYSDKNKTFIDIGANIGYHSLYASRFFREVIAFEPVPSVFEQAKTSAKLNRFKNITFHNLACSDKQKQTFVYIGDDMGGSFISKRKSKNSYEKKLRVKTVSLDKFLKTKSRIGLVKIDVEGMEPSVFKGMEKTIKKHRPVIITEFFPNLMNEHKKGSDKKLLESLMKDHKIIEIETNKEILDPGRHIEKLRRHRRHSNLLLINKKIRREINQSMRTIQQFS